MKLRNPAALALLLLSAATPAAALELHPDKTRLIQFGRYAAGDRKERGLGKPETFAFLGFTHICGKGRSGQFWLKRITIAKRMKAKLVEVYDRLKRGRHRPIPEQ